MIREALEYVAQLTSRNSEQPLSQTLKGSYDGAPVDYEFKITPAEWGRQLGERITPLRPAPLLVTTLTGFLDSLNAGVGASPKEDLSNRVVHVENAVTVALKGAKCDNYGVRDTLLVAKYTPLNIFAFDNYYSDPARFIIQLQAGFLITDELLYVIKVASNLKAGKSIHVQDDGFSQTVVLKAGEVQTTEVNIKPRIKLVPKRTFDEADPVQSEFLLRFKQTAEETPAIALFDVEGTKWQGDSMRAIKKYLDESMTTKIPVLA